MGIGETCAPQNRANAGAGADHERSGAGILETNENE